MKTIDKTPLVDEKGNLGFTQRIQGMLKFGFNWPNELQAQKAIVTYFDRNLEKGYTLLRNITLGQSDIMIPLILLGPAGIFVIHITYLRGRYEARGDSWNVQSGDHYKPAPINLISRTARMARALQVFIERQGVKMPVNVEPVLIAADPGLHIESVRPSIRVMMIDGIKSFVSGVGTSRPVLNAQSVLEFVDRILEPRQPKKDPITSPVQTPAAGAAWEQESSPALTGKNISRARAIFNASEEAKPFNPSDFEFAMETDPDLQAMRAAPRQSNPATPLPAPKQKTRRIFGMTPSQFAILAALALCLICILILGFGYVIPRFS